MDPSSTLVPVPLVKTMALAKPKDLVLCASVFWDILVQPVLRL